MAVDWHMHHIKIYLSGNLRIGSRSGGCPSGFSRVYVRLCLLLMFLLLALHGIVSPDRLTFITKYRRFFRQRTRLNLIAISSSFVSQSQ